MRKEVTISKSEAQKILRGWLRNATSGCHGDMLGYIEGWFQDEDEEAFRMAISALQVKGDLISRADLIKSLEEYDREFMPRWVRKRINEAPAINSNKVGKWIDHSEEGYVECPNCHHTTKCKDNIEDLHYCSYCGKELKKGS